MFASEAITFSDTFYRTIDHSLKFSRLFMHRCIQASGGCVVAEWEETPIVAILMKSIG